MRKHKRAEIGDEVIYEEKIFKVINKNDEDERVTLISLDTNEKIETDIEKIEFMEG